MLKVYEILLDGREDDSQRYWTIFGLLSVINGGLFAAITIKDSSLTMRVLVPLLGIFLSLIWLLVQRRIHSWIVWWEDKLTDYEPYMQEEINQERQSKGLQPVPGDLLIFRQRKSSALGFALSTRRAGWLLPVLFMLAWLALLVDALIAVSA